MKHGYQHMYDLCKQHMHSFVLVEVNDGSQMDGIITGVDNEYVYMAVPLSGSNQNQMMREDGSHERQFGFGSPSYGYGPQPWGPHHGYGYGGGYGHGSPGRRFNRVVLPLAALTALSILPWY